MTVPSGPRRADGPAARWGAHLRPGIAAASARPRPGLSFSPARRSLTGGASRGNVVMTVVISADMEGTAGVTCWAETEQARLSRIPGDGRGDRRLQRRAGRGRDRDHRQGRPPHRPQPAGGPAARRGPDRAALVGASAFDDVRHRRRLRRRDLYRLSRCRRHRQQSAGPQLYRADHAADDQRRAGVGIHRERDHRRLAVARLRPRPPPRRRGPRALRPGRAIPTRWPRGGRSSCSSPTPSRPIAAASFPASTAPRRAACDLPATTGSRCCGPCVFCGEAALSSR